MRYKEIEIAKDQLRQEGKPRSYVRPTSLKEKLNRFFKDNTLVSKILSKDKQPKV